MPVLKACIIGCGAISAVHVDAITQLPSVELAAVADINKDKADEIAKVHKCSSYTDWEKMLINEQPDVVHICTPHFLHASMSIFALEHGINVIIEKPVAIKMADAEKIIIARNKFHKSAAVVFQNRLNESTVIAKQMIDGGEYGKLLAVKGIVTWHRDESYYKSSDWRGKFETEGGGVLINQAIHTLDLLQYFAGSVKSLRAHADNFALNGIIEVEDTISAVLFFKSGARGLLFATTANVTDSPVEIEITLERAKILITGAEAFLQTENEKIVLCNETGNSYKNCWGSSHKKLIKQFYDNLDQPESFVCIEQAMDSLRLIEAIYKSSDSGSAIAL